MMFRLMCFIFLVSAYIQLSNSRHQYEVDSYDLYRCPSVEKNYIVSKYRTDGYTARDFCESHGATLPLFTSYSEISDVFDCLNQDYTGDSIKITFIQVSYGPGGQQKLVLGEEDLRQNLWKSSEPDGGCVLPLNSNLCCATLPQSSSNNDGIKYTVEDGFDDCSYVYEYFLCQIDSYITILGDECFLDLHACSHVCSDDFLGYTCSCPEGLRLAQDQLTCEDVDECTESQPSPCAQACVNVVGSYECECFDGFSPGGKSQECQDDDECALGTSTCDMSIQTCRNTDGGFTCECVQGFETRNNTCVDVDECLYNNGDCVYDCVNTNGSFHCICPDGYRSSGSFSCEDIDECSDDDLNTCEQTCSNTLGTFFCSCHQGYVPQNSTNCEDMDECGETNIVCEHDCVNTDGTFYCTCRDGYSVNIDNSSSCVDNDECTMGTHTCNVNAERCVNSDGTFLCECLQGYNKTRLAEPCLDIDECDGSTNPCGQNCFNTEGSFYCACAVGFTLGNNSRDCFDIDECETAGDSPCSQECVNLYGSFQCRCFVGYVMNRNDTCARSCDCSCKDSTHAAERVDEDTLKKELIVPRSQLSSYIRAKTSASDTRTSAQSLGYFGLAIMLGFGAFIIFLDFNHLKIISRLALGRANDENNVVQVTMQYGT